jgi:hypothetical protein
MEKLSVLPPSEGTNRCVDLAAMLGAVSTGLLSSSPPQLPVGDCSQPLVGTSTFHVDKLKIV